MRTSSTIQTPECDVLSSVRPCLREAHTRSVLTSTSGEPKCVREKYLYIGGSALLGSLGMSTPADESGRTLS